ncbi:mitochondrial carrier protein MTM1-like isoform X2 [Durio zibethinus]|uniref:Mitochondrial carrier protein MTM1-like isoform X2 n=1 Tax=Durio zibethinus TaxID=66656 RepID=A0A6P6B0L0_DURZI|nr:mitochondrial carrier protein MTM1-like isoform X2 [Durio zibethinus]
MVTSRQGLPSWINAAAATRVDFEGNVEDVLKDVHDDSTSQKSKPVTDVDLSFGERAFSAAGAAFLSAVIVNPLDVAKTRLQAQAAGVPYKTCLETNTEGFARLWRGTNASLALAVPTVGIYMPCYDIFRNAMEEFTTNNAPILTPYVPLVAGMVARSLACVTCYPVELARTRMQAFKETQSVVKPAGVWKTLVGVINPVTSTNYIQNLQNYRILWTGLSTQLARDVPFSAICWSTLEPIRRKLLVSKGDEAGACSILGANFASGFVAGSIAAAVTCPLDVVKTRRQIEKEPAKALKMTTRQTLQEIWRDGGIKGLFTGLGPRVGRAGPSVGIVVSFYEVVKYALHHRHEDH